MKPTAPSRRAGGFTLLEALISGAIFFVALVGTTLLAVSAEANAGRSMAFAQGARVATQEMEKYSMLGWNGLGNYFDGGVTPPIITYPINEAPDGGGRTYTVNVQLINSAGQPTGFFDSGLPIPALGSAGTTVPSFTSSSLSAGTCPTAAKSKPSAGSGHPPNQ